MVVNASIFLKYVPFSLPSHHPDILAPRLDLQAQNWFPCSCHGWVPPTKTMDLFFPVVKGPVFGPKSSTLNWCQSSQLPVLFLPGHLGICRLVGWGRGF